MTFFNITFRSAELNIFFQVFQFSALFLETQFKLNFVQIHINLFPTKLDSLLNIRLTQAM